MCDKTAQRVQISGRPVVTGIAGAFKQHCCLGSFLLADQQCVCSLLISSEQDKAHLLNVQYVFQGCRSLTEQTWHITKLEGVKIQELVCIQNGRRRTFPPLRALQADLEAFITADNPPDKYSPFLLDPELPCACRSTAKQQSRSCKSASRLLD